MASVRIFGYAGIIQIRQVLVKQFSSDAVFARQEPYLWSQVLPLNGATPVEMTVAPNDSATMAVIEVPNGVAVRYEYNPNGPLASNHRAAGNASPRMVGDNVFPWVAGATISFVDAATLP